MSQNTSSSSAEASTSSQVTEAADAEQIRLYIPREYYLIPFTTSSAGLALGFLRGARLSSLQYLAENAHRPPRTLEEWYFYHKSKNYRVFLGGLKTSGKEGLRLGSAGLVWVGLEEGARRVGHGVEEWREVVAGTGLAGVVSLAYRLHPRTALQAGILGVMGGSVMTLLRRTKEKIEESNSNSNTSSSSSSSHHDHHQK